MRKRLWDLAKSRIEIATILPGHRHKVHKRKNKSNKSQDASEGLCLREL